MQPKGSQITQAGEQGRLQLTCEPMLNSAEPEEGTALRDPDSFDRFLTILSGSGQSSTPHQSREPGSSAIDQSVQQPVQAEALAGWLQMGQRYVARLWPSVPAH